MWNYEWYNKSTIDHVFTVNKQLVEKYYELDNDLHTYTVCRLQTGVRLS